MFSITLLFALLQLLGFAVSTADVHSPRNDALLNARRDENAVSSKSVTTTSVTKTTSTTASATPNCPKTFYIYIPGGKLGNFYFVVNSTGGYDGNPNRGAAATFAIQDRHLVTLTAPGGAASVPRGTGPKGGFLYSKSDVVKFDPVDAAFNSDCRLVLTKKVSPTVTLNAIYSNVGDDFYFGSTSDPPPNGADLTSIISVERIT